MTDRDIRKVQSFVVIIRCMHTRGADQEQALRELRARGLWLADWQKVAAGIAAE
jgi:hypothetical protein